MNRALGVQRHDEPAPVAPPQAIPVPDPVTVHFGWRRMPNGTVIVEVAPGAFTPLMIV